MDKKILIKIFRQVLLFSGFFNIIFSTPLVFPVISDYYLTIISRINNALNLGGQSYTSPTNAIYSFFVNTAGIDLVLIGIMILYAAIDPIARKKLILFNAVGRLLFTGITAYYVTTQNLIHIILFFSTIDFTLSVIFFYFLYQLRDEK